MNGDASTYVLIPGAWHGGWAWRPVAQRLRAAGRHAICLTLPGLADGDDPTGLRLQDAVDYLVSQVERLNLDQVTLVGHSWAGYPIAGAAPCFPRKLSKIIYYNALVPVRGKSMVEDIPPEVADLIRRLIESSPNRSIPPTLEHVQQSLMQDVPEDVQRLLAELLTAQPGDYFLDALDVSDIITLSIPTQYILSEDDHALPRPGHEFAARLGTQPVMVPGTHEGMLTHPDSVAKEILNG